MTYAWMAGQHWVPELLACVPDLPGVRLLEPVTAPHLPAAVAVWCLQCDFSAGDLSSLLPRLSAVEQARCLRYRRLHDRLRFALVRIILRHLLASRLGCAAAAIDIAYSAYGKPYLPDHPHWHFNVSHSGDRALIAISQHRDVGVDIEALTSASAASDVVTAMTVQERQYCHAHGELALMQIWSGKEAVLKAMGVGITRHFSLVSVIPLSPWQYAVSWNMDRAPLVEAWELMAPSGFVAALALLA
ncbi:4'-phosphopantetheinyl transferase [Methylobacillus rhizosphaerae]|uniref:4'-phosphopantetheinyl transferase n=1 Tax=Methylobacillus rhizosphaerae TaxID=551994 RepID=A0A238YYJ8_9PROT|nr:4'-phosphopantetheinyl transferase superfamily protein [Methylobacillus rhizosphaerae]SNR75821.1 4'-phosphopantetheinyl transferase [Methylobacillus rhizosphaerae]